MTKQSCKKYETCSAPLCPIDRQSLKHGIWYPDEEICRSKTYGNLPWVKAQKEICLCASRADRYFTLEMLQRNCITRKGIVGLDPDEPEGLQLKRWLQDHLERKELSEKEKTILRQRAEDARLRKKIKNQGQPSRRVQTHF